MNNLTFGMAFKTEWKKAKKTKLGVKVMTGLSVPENGNEKKYHLEVAHYGFRDTFVCRFQDRSSKQKATYAKNAFGSIQYKNSDQGYLPDTITLKKNSDSKAVPIDVNQPDTYEHLISQQDLKRVIRDGRACGQFTLAE
jgi:hypothetical protein